MKELSPEERENAEKLLEVAWEFSDCRRGTLWQVREDLWIEVFAGQNYQSDRSWHPGLVLGFSHGGRPVLPGVIMVYGSTGSYGPLVLRGLTGHGGPDRPTSFGALIGPVPGIEFVRRPESATGKNQTKRPLKGWWGDVRRVSVNWDKRVLSTAELQQLESLLPSWLWE